MNERTKMLLPVALSAAEVKERAVECALAVETWREAEAEKKLQTARLTSRVKTAQEETLRLSDIVEKQEEPRLVDCEMFFRYETREVDIIRLDTGAKVKTRDMTDGEKKAYEAARQVHLPFEGAYASGAAFEGSDHES